MDKLFGLPVQQLMWTLLAIFAVGALILAVLAVRDRTSFRMAVRNVPRRRAQSALIVMGLMLATLLFSAAFTTGDTLTQSLRTQALKNIGQVDVVVKAEQPGSGGGTPFGPGAGIAVTPEARERYFDEDLVDKIQNRLLSTQSVAGVAPLAKETVPVASSQTDLSEPRVDVLGMDPASMGNFDRLASASGKTLALGALGVNEVYVSQETAEGLGVGTGDMIETSLVRRSEERDGGGSRPGLKVAGIYERGANPASDASMVMPLKALQNLLGEEGKVNEVLITHGGPAVEGGEYTYSTVSALEPLLADNSLEADPVKKDAIDGAEQRGEIFSTLFVLFGQFSVAAGMLLIFLIFVMLAAERKQELGIARAVGMQRSNLVRAFMFEGALYALVAGALGSVAGVGVGWVMVRLIGRGFAGGGEGFRIAFVTSPRNVILAFCMGTVLTFIVVLLSSWSVSRLNVVRAIRDLPEPDRKGRTVWGMIVAVLLPLAGAIVFWQGLATQTIAFYLGGLSFVLVGGALLARALGLPDRVAFTVSGLVLLALWLTPASLTTPAGMARGPEMFFVSGISIVVAGVWLAIFNADALLWLVVAAFGRLKGLPPVLKTAVKYPTRSLFRTGMTLAMFILVVFTLAAMNFIQAAMGAAFEDTQELSGGFEIQGNVGYATPIRDMEADLEDTKGTERGSITAVGEVSNLPAEIKQEGTDRDLESLYVQGVDGGYSESVGYGFQTAVAGYGSAREVWEALQTEEDTAVISGDLAPSRNSSGFADTEPPVKLTGFYADDAYLPDDLYLHVTDPDSRKARDLRVIGVLESSASFAGDVVTSQGTLDSLAGRPLPPQTYYFDLGSGVDAAATAKTLEKDFAKNGLQTRTTAQLIQDNDATRRIVFVLLRGFMSLGLVVGIAALGVIAARSVVERRQQIGVLRALGFQRRQVWLVFLIESSFVALLGTGVGVGLALGFSGTLIDNIRQGMPGLEYRVPWSALMLIIFVGYAASLLTTYLPARQASKVYPAEALRYE